MLGEFRDFVKTLNIGDYFSVGKIDGSKDKSIGIYSDPAYSRVEAIGGLSSYDRASVRILVHWTKNAAETERAARSLFEGLRYQTDFDMDGIHVQYIDLTSQEPIPVGTDDNGIYEYVIPLVIFYRR